MSFLESVRRSRMLAGALLLLGVGSCNFWSKFQDAADEAPVGSIGSPSAFDSSDFGKSILPLSTGQGSAAAFVATGFNGSHLVLVKIDSGGAVTSSAVSPGSFSDTESSSVSSVAEVPGSVPTRLLLGTPAVRSKDFGRVYSYQLPPPAAETSLGAELVRTLQIPALGDMNSGLGRGVAAGYVAGVEGTADYIFGADNHLAVVIDGVVATTAVADLPVPVSPPGTGDACEVGYDHTQDPRNLVRRPLLAAGLSPGPQQIIVGATHAGTAGKVGIMSVAPGGTTLTCLANIAGTQPQFGRSFAVGDFDGDGAADDLAIGAPPRQVHVYLGWSKLPAGTVPVPLPPVVSDGGLDFGFAITPLNVDGLPGDELLVADPRATVGDKSGAGHVLTFKYDSTGKMVPLTGPLAEIADHDPEADANFGHTVNGLNFNTSRILLIGAANEVFVYFRVGSNIPIPAGATAPDVRTP